MSAFVHHTVQPMKSLYRTIFAFLAFATVGAANAQDGSNAYNFLNVTSSARIYGLGGVNVTLVDDDLTTVDQNPALLGSEMSGMVSLSYMRYLGGSNFAGLRYAHSAGSRGAWSASLRYFGYGSMDETLPDGSVSGSFSPMDIAFGASYSHDITGLLRGGIEIKGLYSSYADYNAFALATDLGINYYDPDKDLSFSMVVANLGGQVKRFNESYDRLPVDIRIGWSQSFGDFPLRFSITAWNLTKWSMPYVETGDGTDGSGGEIKDSFGSNLFRHLVFGADLVASPNYYLSLGYNYKMRTDMATYQRNILSGFTLGGGFRVQNFAVSLALAQPHKGGTTMMFNLCYNLSDILN